MSERLGALRVLVWNDAPQAQDALMTSIIVLKMKPCRWINGLASKHRIQCDRRKQSI